MESLQRVKSKELSVLSEPFVICSDIKSDEDFIKINESPLLRMSDAMSGFFNRFSNETNIKVFSNPKFRNKDLRKRENGYHFQCSFCGKWRNTWQSLRLHFSEHHWMIREFTSSVLDVDSHRCQKCNSLDVNGRVFSNQARLALHMLMEPDHEIEDLLELGVPVWNYVMPSQVLIITGQMIPGQKLPDKHIFTEGWMRQVEDRVTNWLIKNGYLLDIKLGLATETRNKFDKRRLAVDYDRIIKNEASSKVVADRLGTGIDPKTNLGASAFFVWMKENKGKLFIDESLPKTDRAAYREAWRALPAEERQKYYDKAAEKAALKQNATKKVLVLKDRKRIRRKKQDGTYKEDHASDRGSSSNPASIFRSDPKLPANQALTEDEYQLMFGHLMYTPVQHPSGQQQSKQNQQALPMPSCSQLDRISEQLNAKDRAQSNKRGRKVAAQANQKTLILQQQQLPFGQIAYNASSSFSGDAAKPKPMRRKKRIAKLLKELQDEANADVVSDTQVTNNIGCYLPQQPSTTIALDQILQSTPSQQPSLNILPVPTSAFEHQQSSTQNPQSNFQQAQSNVAHPPMIPTQQQPSSAAAQEVQIAPSQQNFAEGQEEKKLVAADAESPISIMSEGQENFYSMLENAIDQSTLPTTAVASAETTSTKAKETVESPQNDPKEAPTPAEVQVPESTPGDVDQTKNPDLEGEEQLNAAMELNQSNMNPEMLDFLKNQLQEKDDQLGLMKQIQDQIVHSIETKLEQNPNRPQSTHSFTLPQLPQELLSHSNKEQTSDKTPEQQPLGQILQIVNNPEETVDVPIEQLQTQQPEQDYQNQHEAPQSSNGAPNCSNPQHQQVQQQSQVVSERNPFQMCDCVGEVSELKGMVRQLIMRVATIESKAI